MDPLEKTPPASIVNLRIDSYTASCMLDRFLSLSDPRNGIESAILAASTTFRFWQPEILLPILEFGRDCGAPSIMKLSGLPVDPALPTTPKSGRPSTEKTTFVSEHVLLGLSDLLGEALGYLTEKEGQIIHDVVPVSSGARSQTNQSSEVFLNCHNDITYDSSGDYHYTNPDFLILFCLRSSPDRLGRTFYLSARRVVELLHPRQVEVLRQPNYRQNAPGTYCQDHADGSPVWSRLRPILSGPKGTPEIAISANGVEGEGAAAESALKSLSDVMTDLTSLDSVLLQPGEALIINNRKCIHAREPFSVSGHGLNRWLQRVYVRRSFWELRDRATSNPRVFQ